ncbi:hypothetical protein CBS147347_11414 [Aspergillus niger]|nr:hypothetical protein CBS147347_11414 [Aspergillus niger]
MWNLDAMDGRCRDTTVRHVTELPTATPSFPQPTGTFFTSRSSRSSSASSLDFCNTTDSYARAKYEAASTPNWETCHLLCAKIISRLLQKTEVVRKVDLYYCGEVNDRQSSTMLLLTAHRLRDDWVQADLSCTDGTLVASAFALCIQKPAPKAHERSLASPISFKDPQGKPMPNDFRFPFTKPVQTPRSSGDY